MTCWSIKERRTIKMAGFNFAQNIIGLNKTNGDIHELEVEVANLSASVLSIAGDVDELELSVADLSASVLDIKGDVDEIGGKLDKVITKKVINGNVYAMALNDGKISVSVPVDGDFSSDFNTVTLSKTQNINVGIYGDIGATSATVELTSISYTNNVIAIEFTPSVTLSAYTTAARGFCLYIADAVTATLSKTP